MVVRDPALEGVGETPWSVRAVLTAPEEPGGIVPGVSVCLCYGGSFVPYFRTYPSGGSAWRRSGADGGSSLELAEEVLGLLRARHAPVPEAADVIRLLESARRQAFLAAVRSLAALSGPAVSPEDAGCAWAEAVLAEEVHSS